MFDDMIADMEADKKMKLFMRRRKSNISVVLYHTLISLCLKL